MTEHQQTKIASALSKLLLLHNNTKNDREITMLVDHIYDSDSDNDDIQEGTKRNKKEQLRYSKNGFM